MKEIKELTGLYSLTKTIGVELKPVGKTQQLIESKKLSRMISVQKITK